jgi:hypothetical protein
MNNSTHTSPINKQQQQQQFFNNENPKTLNEPPTNHSTQTNNDSLNSSFNNGDEVFSNNSDTNNNNDDKTNEQRSHSILSISSPPQPQIRTEFEKLKNWSGYDEQENSDSDIPWPSALWPPPQICTTLDESESASFSLVNMKTQPVLVYIKPPFTYTYMDFVHKLATAFSNMTFACINKPIDEPHITMSINKDFFQNEKSYSILVKKNIIEIIASDSNSLQYSFFTLMQLCKIFAEKSIPSLRVIKPSLR